MAYSNQTIHDMFDALQNRFGAFLVFEDVPAWVLDAENSNEPRFDDFSNMAQEAAA